MVIKVLIASTSNRKYYFCNESRTREQRSLRRTLAKSPMSAEAQTRGYRGCAFPTGKGKLFR